MSPSKLRALMSEMGQPVSIKELAIRKQEETGTFAERDIRKSMKALETAGLVTYETGDQNAKLWTLVKKDEAGTTTETPQGESAESAPVTS